MKKLKTYNQFNESITDKMKGISDDDYKNKIKNLSPEYKIKNLLTFNIDLTKYNFNKISIESNELNDICNAIEKELKNIIGIEHSNVDHVYDTGSQEENIDTGNLTLEISYDDEDDENGDDYFITYLVKQKGLNSPYFDVKKTTPYD